MFFVCVVCVCVCVCVFVCVFVCVCASQCLVVPKKATFGLDIGMLLSYYYLNIRSIL